MCIRDRPGSVHRSPWPDAEGELLELLGVGDAQDARWGDAPVLDMSAEVLGAVRHEKTARKRSLRARVERVTVTDTPDRLGLVDAARADLMVACGIDAGGLQLVEGGVPSVQVSLHAEQ